MHPSTQCQQVSRLDANCVVVRSKAHLRLKVIAASLALAFGGTGALAAPQGGVVQAGAARIVQTNPTRLDILQSTNRAIINWQRFNIGTGEQVAFQLPSSQSATLNRVIGVDPSVILGRLSSNGTVFLVNPNGVLFGPGSKIDVGSLIATTAGISNENFMAGRYRFDKVTNRFATVINRGEITAADGGLVALVAPGVENTGIIRANLGKVALASGHAFTLDLYGDKLIALAIDDKVAEKLTDPEGRPLQAYVNQAGTIEADAGTVLLTANVAKTVLDHVINLSGTIQARSFAQHGGEIVLYGGKEGTVTVAGSLDASGTHAGDTGGRIQVLGENVQFASTSRLNVSGQAGGGTALVGGDWQGSGATPRATNATFEAGSKISADAIASGNGGTVVVWAEGTTRFAGEISARGGAQSGHGGNVEVSGKGTLGFTGLVDAAAPNGKAGTLLLDPTDWIIGTTEANSFSRTLRQGTNVAIQADRDIEVNESIDGRGGSAGASLALSAGNQIRLNNDLLTNNGAIDLTSGVGGVQMGLGSRATGNQGAAIFAGTQPITIVSVGSISAQHLITTGAVNLATTGANANVVLNKDLNGADASLGSLAINATGGIQSKGLTATGTATLTAGQGLAFAPSESNSFAAGAITAKAGGDISVSGDLLARNGGAIDLASSGGRITMGPGGINGASTLAAEGGGTVSVLSAQKLTVGDVLTTGAVRLESTADTLQLTKPLLGAKDTNGIGPLTIRTATDLTIDQPVKSTGGIDIQAGGADAISSRALVVAVGATNRLEANASAAASKRPIALTGRKVEITSGEVHSNGGNITLSAINGGVLVGGGIEEKEFGRFEISRTAGLFAQEGDITIRATERVNLTQLSLTGTLDVESTNGAIFIDSDLGADLVDVATNTRTPQPVGSVTLTAGGSYTQDRTYFTNYDFTVGPTEQPSTTTTRTDPSEVGVRMRAIKSTGPVNITSTSEILVDGAINAQDDVSLAAPAIRARHSIFVEGGNITVGGRLTVEPWGDEIGGGTPLLPSNSFPSALNEGAPGGDFTGRPSRSIQIIYGTFDEATSQITLRAVANSGKGGLITLNSGVGREPDIRVDQQFVQLDRAVGTGGLDKQIATLQDELGIDHNDVVATLAAIASFKFDRKQLPLVPMNDFRLNLQTSNGSNGVVFRVKPITNKFEFVGIQETPRLPEGSPTNDINEAYFRLSIATVDGGLIDTTPSAVSTTGAPIPNGFTGLLSSFNGNPPGQVTAAKGDILSSDGVVNGVGDPVLVFDPPILPGANFKITYINPTGTVPPPAATAVDSTGFNAKEIFPNAGSGVGGGLAGSPSAGFGGLGGAREIAGVGVNGGGGGTVGTTTTSQVAAQSQAASLTEGFEREEALPIDLCAARSADLGRLQSASGATPDVFNQCPSLVSSRTELPSTADPDYFVRGIFDYLDSDARRKRQPNK